MDILKLNIAEITYLTISLLCIVKNAASLDCYQCDSTKERTCAEALPQHHTLYADSCDHIQEAQYCVKMTGVFEGELGTKRFCSSKDWGNYCEWIRRPGDEREYRACVFSCWGNSCNAGHIHSRPTGYLILPSAIVTLILYKASWMLLS